MPGSIIIHIKNIQKEICTQRKSATAAITPRADKAPETVEDEARLNTGDALAELLLSVVEPEPVLAPAPVPVAAVGEEAAAGETLAVAEWIPAEIEGVAELMRVSVMPGRLEGWPVLLPAEISEPEPVESSSSPSPWFADTPEPGPLSPTRETLVSLITPPSVVAVPVTVTIE